MVKRPVAFVMSALMFSTALVVAPPEAQAADPLPSGFVGETGAPRTLGVRFGVSF